MDVNAKVIPFELLPMGLIEVFSRLGADIQRLLQDTGIPRSFIGCAGNHISYAQQQQLVRNGLHLCPWAGLGLLLGLQLDWSYYGSVGSILNCSPSLKEAGAALRRFLPVAQPHYARVSCRPGVYMDKGGVMVNLLLPLTSARADPQLARFETDFRLATTLRLYDQCGNKNVPQREVDVFVAGPEPRHAELYTRLPCHNLTFGAIQSAVVCHHRFLTSPWRQLRLPIYQRILEQCEAELSQSGVPQSFTSRVRWHISLSYNQPVTLEQIAGQLALSSRMLSRRLASEGSSFRQLVHQQRMALAALHLRWSSLSVDEVAELMGFSSPSSLRRAVKSWSGQTAGHLRQLRHPVGAGAWADRPQQVSSR